MGETGHTEEEVGEVDRTPCEEAPNSRQACQPAREREFPSLSPKPKAAHLNTVSAPADIFMNATNANEPVKKTATTGRPLVVQREKKRGA